MDIQGAVSAVGINMGSPNHVRVAPKVHKTRSSKERVVQLEVEAMLNSAHTEVPCEVGIVDILTDASVIEVKHCNAWKHALGQCLAYRECFPTRRAKLVLFGYAHEIGGLNLSAIEDICRSLEVVVGVKTISKGGPGTVLVHDSPHARVRNGTETATMMDIERERTRQLALQLRMREIAYDEKLLASENRGVCTAVPGATPCELERGNETSKNPFLTFLLNSCVLGDFFVGSRELLEEYNSSDRKVDGKRVGRIPNIDASQLKRWMQLNGFDEPRKARCLGFPEFGAIRGYKGLRLKVEMDVNNE